VALKIIEERGPIWSEVMHLEIVQREREAMVDADQRRSILGQPLDQPFGGGLPAPVFSRRMSSR
jgi:hypothetical protein